MDDKNFLLTYFALGLKLPNHAFYAMVKGHPIFFTAKELYNFMHALALEKKWVILEELGYSFYKQGVIMHHEYFEDYVSFAQVLTGGEPDEIFYETWRMKAGHFFRNGKLVPFSEWIDSYIKHL